MSIFTYEDVLPFGTEQDGVLRIENSFTVEKSVGAVSQCMLVTAFSKYEGESAPHINFSLSIDGQEKGIYKSHFYRFGKEGQYTIQSWRVPPAMWPKMKVFIYVKIPEGTVVYLKNMNMDYGAPAERYVRGIRFNSHLGLLGMAPDNTMPALELAAMCGYPSCIVVPKVTKDGVFVCIHDDTINRTGRDADGNKLPEEPMYVKDMTYEELLKYDFGVAKNPVYKGTQIPLLEDFFKLCARTGMRPMFSTHPDLTIEQWEQVKAMLRQYNLLEDFHIKVPGTKGLKNPWKVFGSSIDGYTVDTSKFDKEMVGEMLESGLDVSACRVVVEVRQSCITQEIVDLIKSVGMHAAAWNMPHQCRFEEYERLIEMGVTEFTEDYHCSMGLNF